jgi:quercetin dioxygenase-like cupin family protein
MTTKDVAVEKLSETKQLRIGSGTLYFFEKVALKNMEFVIGKLEPGESLNPHYHKTPAEEIYYVYKGACKVSIAGQVTRLEEGSALYVPPGVIHYPTNDTKETCWIAFFLGPGGEDTIVEVKEQGEYKRAPYEPSK